MNSTNASKPPARNRSHGKTSPDLDRAHNYGHPKFYNLLNEIAELHSRKSFDYTPADDPLANFHRSSALGVEPWRGALVRMGDKFGRLEQLGGGKQAKNESLRDTLIDLAVYSLLTIVLLEEDGK